VSGNDGGFLSRWSRRKHEAAREPAAVPGPAAAAPPALAPEGERPEATPRTDEPRELPPVETLTPDSDFSPFMGDKVDPETRRAALKTLFKDPRFNVMDGLDVYIDDYSKPDPIPPEWLGQLAQMAGLGDVAGREEAERKAREAAARGAGQPIGQADGEPPASGAEGAPPGSAIRDQPADNAPVGMQSDCQGEPPADLSGSKKPHEN
jgi:hypothetical protein